jgi:murein DD-endopeptidase MepM/ murein hydrolase activator NlpD
LSTHTPRDFVVLSLLSVLLFSTIAFAKPTGSEGVVADAAPIPAREDSAPADYHAAESDVAPFIWPVGGGITSYFDASHPLGIDISLFDRKGAPIKAAAAGDVILAGGSRCCGYGIYVIVDHGGGVTSRYGHLESLAVEKGQQVAQGQIIGIGGDTGASTSRHLHFEVRRDNKPIDPLLMLPSTCREAPGRHKEVASDVPGGCVPGDYTR